MKNNKLFIILCVVAAFVTVACTKKAADPIKITYYASLNIKGDNPYKVAKGSTYTDPGCTAEMKGEDVSDKITVDQSAVDTSVPDVYDVTYTVVNADGFPAVATRKVHVVNTTPGELDNVYNSYCRYGSRQYNVPFVIYAYSPGIYIVEDLMGGFYCYGRYPGYEPTYDFHCEAAIAVNGDNSLSIVSNPDDWYFKGSFDFSDFTGTYDPATGVLNWTIEGSFYVTLTPEKID